MMIREITGGKDLRDSISVIRASFQTVAEEFDITEENCPTNPAFIRLEHLELLLEKGVRLFGLFAGGKQVGFMVIDREEEAVYCVRRLAVLPERRHGGLGRKLMEYAYDYARTGKGRKVTVRIMDNNLRLKEWYKALGFVETDTKQFEKLPFAVSYMEKIISA